jgi:hypothetical protein
MFLVVIWLSSTLFLIFWMIGSGHSVLLRKISKAKNDVEPKKLKNGHTYLPFERYFI